MINQSFVFSVLAAAAAAAARYTIRFNITLQPSCLSTHFPCCAEHSCLIAWPSSNPEPSPKLAPQQQMKSSQSAAFPQTLYSQSVLSERVVAGVPSPWRLIVTLCCSLSFSSLLCAVRSWCAGCCCATRGLRACYVPPLPLYYIGFRIGLFS